MKHILFCLLSKKVLFIIVMNEEDEFVRVHVECFNNSVSVGSLLLCDNEAIIVFILHIHTYPTIDLPFVDMTYCNVKYYSVVRHMFSVVEINENFLLC
jgi:hypothetical protein